MAFPEDLSRISSNLSGAELEEVIKAVNEERVEWVPGSTSIALGSCGGLFDYKGGRYEMSESFEMVTSLNLIRAEQRVLKLAEQVAD